jgi:hypothetical protein
MQETKQEVVQSLTSVQHDVDSAGHAGMRTCPNCSTEWNLSQSEAEWFVAKKLALPRRCRDCRLAKRLVRKAGEGRAPPNEDRTRDDTRGGGDRRLPERLLIGMREQVDRAPRRAVAIRPASSARRAGRRWSRIDHSDISPL